MLFLKKRSSSVTVKSERKRTANGVCTNVAARFVLWEHPYNKQRKLQNGEKPIVRLCEWGTDRTVMHFASSWMEGL